MGKGVDARLHAFGGVAEHRGGDHRSVTATSCFRLCLDHAADRSGRPYVDDPRDAVEPRDIHHRRHHGDVLEPDVRRRVARGHRRYAELGNPERQGAHCGGHHRAAPASSQPDHAVEAALRMQSGGDDSGPGSHDFHRLPAIPTGAQLLETAAPGAGDLRSIDIDRKQVGASEHPAVHRHYGVSPFGDFRTDEIVVRPFCVECSDQQDRSAHLCFSSCPTGRRCPPFSAGG